MAVWVTDLRDSSAGKGRLPRHVVGEEVHVRTLRQPHHCPQVNAIVRKGRHVQQWEEGLPHLCCGAGIQIFNRHRELISDFLSDPMSL